MTVGNKLRLKMLLPLQQSTASNRRAAIVIMVLVELQLGSISGRAEATMAVAFSRRITEFEFLVINVSRKDANQTREMEVTTLSLLSAVEYDHWGHLTASKADGSRHDKSFLFSPLL